MNEPNKPTVYELVDWIDRDDLEWVVHLHHWYWGRSGLEFSMTCEDAEVTIFVPEKYDDDTRLECTVRNRLGEQVTCYDKDDNPLFEVIRQAVNDIYYLTNHPDPCKVL